MKKKIALLLLTVMAVSLVACGKKDSANNDEVAKTGKQAESALDVLSSTWATYEDDNKFAAGGGDSMNMTMDEQKRNEFRRFFMESCDGKATERVIKTFFKV